MLVCCVLFFCFFAPMLFFGGGGGQMWGTLVHWWREDAMGHPKSKAAPNPFENHRNLKEAIPMPTAQEIKPRRLLATTIPRPY